MPQLPDTLKAIHINSLYSRRLCLVTRNSFRALDTVLKNFGQNRHKIIVPDEFVTLLDYLSENQVSPTEFVTRMNESALVCNVPVNQRETTVRPAQRDYSSLFNLFRVTVTVIAVPKSAFVLDKAA